MDQPGIRLLVSGRVQGVGFRWWLSRQAQHLPIRGWVRNLPDGRVEIVATGGEHALDEIERLAATGPHPARVDDVDKSDFPHHMIDVKSFFIK